MGDLAIARSSAVRATALFLAAFISAAAAAQRAPQPLTLDAAIENSLAQNPGLRAAGFSVETARAGRQTASLPSPFALEAEIENFAGTGDVAGVDGAEVSLLLSKALERGDKRLFRRELGTARLARAETQAYVARLDLAAETVRRFIQAAVSDERLQLARESVELRNATLDVVQRSVEVGRGSEAELASMQVEVAEADLELAEAMRRLEIDRYRLVSLWSELPVAIETVGADLFSLPPVPAFNALMQRIDESPDLLVLFDDQRIAAAEQRVARSRARADLSLGFGLRYLAEPADTALVFSVGVPLGNRTRSSLAIAEAASAQARVPELVAQRRLELRTLLFELRTQLSIARERFVQLGDELQPVAERAVAAYRNGFEVGSDSLFELTAAQRKLLEIRQARLAAAAEYHQTLVDIEQLLGGIDRNGEYR